MIFGVLRAQGGTMAEENRLRSPVTGSVRLSLTRGAADLNRAGGGEHLPGLVVAVAYDQTTPILVALAGELRDVGVDLGFERLGEHAASAFPDDMSCRPYADTSPQVAVQQVGARRADPSAAPGMKTHLSSSSSDRVSRGCVLPRCA
ncbi:hypothetical protein Pth03_74460 [Planotetraspora thailandica]|uniref:Uncharacterized protein n=1 Tax=Planotetraspora thailandica TaxID=487172 RepID=A0A8J4DFM2_9ACTN|nr:hypothetical protein Pth03_74460 [Planotetraspora thailandica]